MGQPMLLFVFLNLYKGNYKWADYFFIAFFAFYSWLVFSGVFICISLSIWWMYLVFHQKKIHLPFLCGIILLLICYLVVEYQMIAAIFDPTIVTQRSEFQLEVPAFAQLVKLLIHDIRITPYHPGMFWTLPIILLLGVNLFLYKNIDKLSILLISIIGIIILIGLVYPYVTSQLGFISIVKMFHWGRFFFLLPLLWILLLAVLLYRMITYKWRRLFLLQLSVLAVLSVMSVNIVYFNEELRKNVSLLVGGSHIPTWSGFFDPPLFEKINKYIGKQPSDYRIVSVGLHPSVATYNGFYCLDSYLSLYLLSYKHQFRKLIAGELEKNPRIKAYFDDWGCRCYVFSSELENVTCSKYADAKIYNLAFNTAEFSDMGGEYVFSAAEIVNCEMINLKLLDIFEGRYWKIYLYQTNL
jgi:hypothetical protein